MLQKSIIRELTSSIYDHCELIGQFELWDNFIEDGQQRAAQLDQFAPGTIYREQAVEEFLDKWLEEYSQVVAS
jgi:hypothetical protein